MAFYWNRSQACLARWQRKRYRRVNNRQESIAMIREEGRTAPFGGNTDAGWLALAAEGHP